MAGDLYEQDFIGWTEQQARLLREAAVPVAVRRAASDLLTYGEHDAAARVRLDGAVRYTLDQVLDEDWLPARPDMPALTRA